MNDLVPTYRELYSISDLHLGGWHPKMQMFCQGRRLQAFIESLASNEGPFALVIAGDVIDSLPYLEPGSSYISLDGAADIMQRVMTDQSFSGVFDGLRTFLAAEQRELVLMTGNHDLELAMPEAQEALLNHIAPTPSARGRVRWVTDGTGFRCRVGTLNVFVTHGHEADYWNHVDYEALRKAAHLNALGIPFDARTWIPNAGTKLVVDVMNRIKSRYPFIDLLKPERKAAVKVLTVLAPEIIKSFFGALPAFAKAAWAYTGPHVVLGADGRRTVAQPEVIDLLQDAFNETAYPSRERETGLIERVAKLQGEGRSPADLVEDSDADLGRIRYAWDRLTGKAPSAALRTALQGWLSDDVSFDLADRDTTYSGILSQVGAGVDVVITGHTHLPRWIEVTERDNLVYLNAGTWARLIGLRDEFLTSEAAFQPVYDALMADDIRVLDETAVDSGSGNGTTPIVLDATAAAHVGLGDDGRTRARLVRITSRNGEQAIEEVKRKESILSWL